MSFQVYQAQGLRIFSGDTATCAAYTGNAGELSINTETKAVYVHDGLTAGGTPLTTAEAAELAGITLGQLANIELSSPTDGQTLVFNETSGVWENQTVAVGSGSGSGSGTGLALNISNPADGQALVYASGQWVNQAVAASGGSNPSIIFVASIAELRYYNGQVIEPWTIRHHNGDCFNTNGTFTAPRAGVYRFDYHNNHDDADGGAQWLDWLHNGVELGYSRIYGHHSGGWENMSGHLIIELAQGDTIQLRGQANVRPDVGAFSLWSGYLMHDAAVASAASSSGGLPKISYANYNITLDGEVDDESDPNHGDYPNSGYYYRANSNVTHTSFTEKKSLGDQEADDSDGIMLMWDFAAQKWKFIRGADLMTISAAEKRFAYKSQALGDISLDSPADGDILVYDGDSQTWKNVESNPNPSATGGDVSDITDANGQNWRVHKFTSSGQFEVTQGPLEVEYLVVAGGGGGYSYLGGGGGGGYRSSVQGESSGGNTSPEAPLNLAVGVYQVQVGAGGVGALNGHVSNAGGDSSFDTIVSIGGGAQWDTYVSGSSHSIANGGSGAGGEGNHSPYGSGTTGQGHNGGHGGHSGITWYTSGGGGGAGGAGESVGGNQYGGRGGLGLTSSITGTAVDYAGGGGGGCWGRYSTGYSGTARSSSAVPQTNVAYAGAIPDAPANQGGGGAGQWSSSEAQIGSGGSGIVVVRYKM